MALFFEFWGPFFHGLFQKPWVCLGLFHPYRLLVAVCNQAILRSWHDCTTIGSSSTTHHSGEVQPSGGSREVVLVIFCMKVCGDDDDDEKYLDSFFPGGDMMVMVRMRRMMMRISGTASIILYGECMWVLNFIPKSPSLESSNAKHLSDIIKCAK